MSSIVYKVLHYFVNGMMHNTKSCSKFKVQKLISFFRDFSYHIPLIFKSLIFTMSHIQYQSMVRLQTSLAAGPVPVASSTIFMVVGSWFCFGDRLLVTKTHTDLPLRG